MEAGTPVSRPRYAVHEPARSRTSWICRLQRRIYLLELYRNLAVPCAAGCGIGVEKAAKFFRTVLLTGDRERCAT